MLNGAIDLHLHSTVSDGTDTPVELLERVREAGIRWFALTDHDAVKGCGVIRGALGADDPRFLNGVEFSCRDDDGKYHILGYGFDPDSPSVQRLVEAGHSIRMNKVAARLDFLRTAFGFTFPDDEIRDLLSLDNPGKPHIGNLMVKYGYAPSKEAAIDEYIDRAKIRSGSIRPEEAIQGILQGGGIPVLAHPAFGSGSELILGDAMDRRLRRLIDMGLQGVEAFYSGFSPMLQNEILALAEKYRLYVTAGSDYHGSNKLVTIGDTNLDSASAMPEGLMRFLEEAGRA
ncbi:MAG: PHP domain-containing protein [Clostridia bacterium]|nr:PHP domain-containing protein [Clostridia bacterium]